MRAAVLLLVVAATRAAAQQAVCNECAQGDALIDKYGLQPVRAIAGELAGTALVEPLTKDQYGRLVELRKRAPALGRLAALEESDLALIGAALCKAPSGGCQMFTTQALRCLADRCAVDFGDKKVDIVEKPAECDAYGPPKRTPPFGLGVDWGTGWTNSKYPTDGRAWSLGIEGRLRLTHRLGLVARIDRTAARDEATDADGDGDDDISTGQITRISGLAGPSLVLGASRWEDDTIRFLRIDLLGGYLSSRSLPDESGPAAGIDISYHLYITHFGVRVIQGFGDAKEATMIMGHIGMGSGGLPMLDEDKCHRSKRRPTHMAIGFDIPLGGYGISKEHGLLAGGLAIEGAWHVSRRFDILTRGDILVFPGDDRERVIHQAVLAGIRYDHTTKRRHDTGFFSTWMVGYSHGAGITPSEAGTGMVGDVSLGWGAEDDDFAAGIRLHGRFGITPDNEEYRAIFLSGGFEIRLDPDKWRDRS
jgi:hypothetical protein